VLTANGHIMGERFTNSGPLNLVANFASSGGKTASTVVIYEGVPGRNGTVDPAGDRPPAPPSRRPPASTSTTPR
jgi:hypothetical protein